MTKEGSITTDAFLLTTSKIIGNLLTLVSAMLLARIRTLEENGIYSELLLIINLATSVFMLGLPNSINFFLAKAETKRDKNRFLSLYYTLSTILSIVLGVVLVSLLPLWIRYFSNQNLAQYAFFLLLFPWAKVVIASVENVLVVLGKSKTIVWYRITNSVCLLLIILIVWVTNSSFTLYMVLYVVVEGAYAIAVYILVAKYTGRLHWNIDKQLIRSVLSFSIPLGLASIVGTLNIEIDKLMIGHFLTTEELAIYSYASKELPLTIVATSLTAVLIPRMVRLFQQNRNEEAVAVWRDVNTISFAIMAFFGIGMAVFSREAMVILYSEKYAAGSYVFAIYSVGLLLKCTYFGMVLNTTGKTKIVLYSSIGTLALNCMLNYILFQIVGVVGPALATVLSSLIMGLYQLFFSAKLTKIPFSLIFPWKSIAILTLVNVALGVAFSIVHRLVFPGNWQAVVLAVLWAFIYFAILFAPGKKIWERIREA